MPCMILVFLIYSFNRKKCDRPDASPATIVTPSGATAQQNIALSPIKLAISCLLSKSHSFKVLSIEAEIAIRPSGEIATVLNQFV